MSRTRLITLLLALALALASTPAVMAQDESPAADDPSTSAFDPSGVEEWDEDEAIIFYRALEDRLLAMGVAEEDLDDAYAYVQDRLANMSEEDLEDVAEMMAAQGLADEMTTEEEGEAVDIGDDEFLQSDEDEPEIDIEIGDDEEEEEGE